MGLLDDAIREHLDLKRRRGGDPAEIERAEREALGPVRRNRDNSLGDEPDGRDEVEYAAAGSARDEPDEGIAADLVDETGDPPLFDDERAVAGVMSDDPPTAEELVVSFDDEGDPFAGDDDDPFAEDDDAYATRVMRTVDIPEPAERTAEFDVEQEFAAEDEAHDVRRPGDPESDEDEDVLEETPEFLQDTPDHDRLWFEQRPPRDFDFDN